VWKPLEVRWYKTLGWWDELHIAKFSLGILELETSCYLGGEQQRKNIHKTTREIKW